jgi:putative CocE/NonD family hydrolase
VEGKDDVLVYVTPPLEEDLEITGPVKLILYAASSARDTDFMAKLVDVHPTGFVQRLCDGMVRARFRNGMERPELIGPGKIYAYQIDLWNTSQVFFKGHCIGLEVSSSAFPKYDRNLNTGEDLGSGSRMLSAEQTIYHDQQHPSALVLPVIPH